MGLDWRSVADFAGCCPKKHLVGVLNEMERRLRSLRWFKRFGQEASTASLKAELRQRVEELRALRSELAALRQASKTQVDDGPDDRSRGVFVIGCPRSGTSVFSWALAQHPNFWTSAESDYLLELFGGGHLHGVYKRAFERKDGGWLKKQNVGFAEFAEKLGMGIEALYTSRAKGCRWIDATPGYTLMIAEVMRLFPAASLLHIVRDGRAVVNSMVSSGFETDWASDFEAACQTWVHYAELGHEAAGAHPQRMLEVRHDELAAQPQRELGRVFEFLGETPCERSVELISTKRINSSYGNIGSDDIRSAKDPATAPARPWQTWSTQQNKTFAAIAGETMSKFGYELTD